LNNDGLINDSDLKIFDGKILNVGKSKEIATESSERGTFGWLGLIKNHNGEAVLIDSYDDLVKYLTEVLSGFDSATNIDEIKSKYNEDFFKSNSIIFYAGNGATSRGIFESVSIENNCISLNLFSGNLTYEYQFSTHYLVVALTKEELSKYNYTSVKSHNTAIDAGDKVSADIFVTNTSIEGLDRWINSKEEFNNFVSEFILNIDDMSKYDDNYFSNNKLIAYGAESTYYNPDESPAGIITLYDDKYISVNIKFGSIKEGSIYFITIPNSIYKNQQFTIRQDKGID
jgi:hypothetical protein